MNAPPSLDRRLGPLDAAAIVISNVIGGGIFFVPIIVAQMVPRPSLMIGVWIWAIVVAVKAPDPAGGVVPEDSKTA